MHHVLQHSGRRLALVLGATAVAISGAESAFATAALPHAEEGIPFVERFTPREYGAHSQSLRLALDSRGFLHVANLVTLLQYDGATWRRLA
ncbi:MAG TPA: hypothetical protein VMM36_06420, partial [Opitutaceae bacterium]|nr:hypothetical protein [Opitutaceae bacterium]